MTLAKKLGLCYLTLPFLTLGSLATTQQGCCTLAGGAKGVFYGAKEDLKNTIEFTKRLTFSEKKQNTEESEPSYTTKPSELEKTAKNTR